MTDRELLELAARAANIGDYYWNKNTKSLYIRVPGQNNPAWNPLTNDGDAFRLCIDLKITAQQFVDHYTSGPDPYEAARRAIVQAAADIGNQQLEANINKLIADLGE